MEVQQPEGIPKHPASAAYPQASVTSGSELVSFLRKASRREGMMARLSSLTLKVRVQTARCTSGAGCHGGGDAHGRNSSGARWWS